MRLSPRYNPAGGIADFWNEIRRPTPYRWPVLILSMLCSGFLLYWIMRESVLVPPEPPKVSFISTLEAGRSDAEIIASNIENQRRKDKLDAEQAARDEAVKDAYRALGRASGMDVDAIDRRVAAENAAAEQARRQALEKDAGAERDPVAPAAR